MTSKHVLIALVIVALLLLLGLSNGFRQTTCQHKGSLLMTCSDGHQEWTQPAP